MWRRAIDVGLRLLWTYIRVVYVMLEVGLVLIGIILVYPWPDREFNPYLLVLGILFIITGIGKLLNSFSTLKRLWFGE